jgi:hypothetical protein
MNNDLFQLKNLPERTIKPRNDGFTMVLMMIVIVLMTIMLGLMMVMLVIMIMVLMLMVTLIMTDDDGAIIIALESNALHLFNGISHFHKAMQGKAWQGKTHK